MPTLLTNQESLFLRHRGILDFDTRMTLALSAVRDDDICVGVTNALACNPATECIKKATAAAQYADDGDDLIMPANVSNYCVHLPATAACNEQGPTTTTSYLHAHAHRTWHMLKSWMARWRVVPRVLITAVTKFKLWLSVILHKTSQILIQINNHTNPNNDGHFSCIGDRSKTLPSR